MIPIKGLFYGRVRMTAFQFWGGPSYAVKHGEDPFSGFCLRHRPAPDLGRAHPRQR